jgi:hypothetical protein
MKAVNEIGNRYGMLLVIEGAENHDKKSGAKWLCLCDCGNKVVIRGAQLRKNMQKSCGCVRTTFINMDGRKFGKLLVLKRIQNNKRGYPRFLCRCDCGTEKEVDGAVLRSGRINSCGCAKFLPHGKLPPGEGSFNNLYAQVKYNAKYRGLDFELSKEFFKWISKQPCHYCGVEPYQVHKQKRSNGSFVFNGIDRVDNNIGYIESNCVPCCGRCNYMKNSWSVEEIKDWIVTVYNHWASK